MDSSIEGKTNDSVLTVEQLIFASFADNYNKPFLGTKNTCLKQSNTKDNIYSFKCYSEVKKRMGGFLDYFSSEEELYSKFVHNNIEYNVIGLLAKPCEESFIIMITLMRLMNVVVLPINDNIQQWELLEIINKVPIKTLIVDSSCLNKLFIKDNYILNIEKNQGINYNRDPHYNSEFLSQIKTLKNLILIDEIENSSSFDFFKQSEIKITNLSDIEKTNLNKKSEVLNEHINGTDRIILLLYTPTLKGVMLSEKSLMSTINNLITNNILNIPESSLESPTYYSHTSLADINELCNLLILSLKGGQIGFMSGNITNIFDDIQILRPTIIYSTPQIFCKIYDSLQFILQNLDEGKSNMIRKAVKAKTQHFVTEKSLDHHIWDKIVFNKIKNSLGGSLSSFLISGHLDPHIAAFLRISLSVDILELYGSVETCGLICISDSKDLDTKFIGRTVHGTKIKIKKCNSVNFYSHKFSDEKTITNCGEICVLAENLFSGYFMNKIDNVNIPLEKTNENCICNSSPHLDEEGYFHTGDYAVHLESPDDKSQHLKFIDRIENFITTREGFLISSRLLEEIYNVSELVTSVVIIDDENKNLVGLVNLNRNKRTKRREHADSVDLIGERKTSFADLNESKTLLYRTEKKKSVFRVRNRAYSTLQEQEEVNNKQFINKTILHNENSDYNREENCDDLSFLKNSSKIKKLSEDVYDPNEDEVLIEEILKSFKSIWNFQKLKSYEAISKIFILDNNYLQTSAGKLKYKNSNLSKLLDVKYKYKREALKSFYLSINVTK